MSLRFLFILAAVALCLLGALTGGTLIFATRSLHRSTESIALNTEGLRVASDIDLLLRDWQRVGNFVVTLRSPEYIQLRDQIHEQLRRQIQLARQRAQGQTETHLIDEIQRRTEAYIEEREAVERTGLALGPLLVRMRPRIEAALASINELRLLHDRSVEASTQEAGRTSRFVRAVGIGVALFAGLAVLSLFLSTRRHIYQPLRGITQAVGLFQKGDREARANERAPSEIKHLAHTFNQLADQLMRQRERQLAFLAGVAHDLRTPLGALKLSIEILLKSPPAEERLHHTLSLAHRQLHRLDRMVSDLLDASRIEAGQLELRLERCDLRMAAREVVELYGPLSASHQLSLSIPPEPVLIEADSTRIAQILGNLVSNAIKYSPEGGRVEVRVSDEGERVVLAVSDQGRGISPDEIEDIFVPFRRSPASRDSIPGTGLGLSVVRRIVQGHGGEIQVISTPGLGSTFMVLLPRRPTAGAQADESAWAHGEQPELA
jgi:two-component system sensor histidine kinase MtrB